MKAKPKQPRQLNGKSVDFGSYRYTFTKTAVYRAKLPAKGNQFPKTTTNRKNK